jgi:hypothetical protein
MLLETMIERNMSGAFRRYVIRGETVSGLLLFQ